MLPKFGNTDLIFLSKGSISKYIESIIILINRLLLLIILKDIKMLIKT